MGIVDKFINFMNGGEEDPDDENEIGGYSDDDYIENDIEDEYTDDSEDKNIRSFPKLTPGTRSRKMATSNNPAVCVFKPSDFSETREITQTLRENRTIILNLDNTDSATAQRIVDFTSGACFALDGTLQKISNSIIIVTPKNVDLSGDFQDTITEHLGF